jgi:hypothetical protein
MENRTATEPRWPAYLALLAMGGLYLALPENLAFGPRWVPLIFSAALGLLMALLNRATAHHLGQRVGYVTLGVVTAYTIISLFLLVHALPQHTEAPVQLLRSAALLWTTNLLLFASWYWRLDAGGPHKRDARLNHTDGAFLFPQMALPREVQERAGLENWSPNFVDYLFLAFSTSTAFSACDTFPLSRWAKIFMMIQVLISFSVILLLAARSVNIL